MYTARSDGDFNPYTFSITAGGIIPVSSNDRSNPSIDKLPQAGDVGTGQIIIEEKQQSINKAFFVDPLGDITDPVRSATEQTMRMQEFLRDQGASIGRMRTELVNKVILACVDIAGSKGLLPKGIKVDGKQIKIVHNTVLTQAENQNDFQNLVTWMQTLIGLIPPEVVFASVKIEDLPKGMGEMLNIPVEYLRPNSEKQDLVNAAREVLSGQAQAAAAGQGSVQQAA